MNKFIFSVGLIFLMVPAGAQILSPQAINNGGQSHNNGGVILEDALGGLVVNSVVHTSILYTQDLLQPDAGTTTQPPVINDVVLSSGQGLDVAGTTLVNGNAMLEFTVGEFASLTLGNSNHLVTQGILQPYTNGSALPVIGLEFLAKRISPTEVQLDWKTVQEIHNKGFHIERKKDNDPDFGPVLFVPTQAPGGNSLFPLTYQKRDPNPYAGKTFYRIRQEDEDGSSHYSLIRMVTGQPTPSIRMQVWPIPSSGPVQVLVTGLAKPDQLLVLDMNGKKIQQIQVNNQSTIQLRSLPAGTYVIRLVENPDLLQKIVIQ